MPLGAVSKSEIAAVQQGFERAYKGTIRLLPAQPMPNEAHYKPRARYRAEKILDRLDQLAGNFDKVIAVTERDISTAYRNHADWGIMGLGRLAGNSCVVSTFRLKKRGGLSPSERLSRIAAHELGHTFGLEHCSDQACLMLDGGGKIESVDATSGGLCAKCRKLARPVGIARR